MPHIPTPGSPHPKARGLRPVRLSGPPLSHARAQPLEKVHGPLLSGVQHAFARVVHSNLDTCGRALPQKLAQLTTRRKRNELLKARPCELIIRTGGVPAAAAAPSAPSDVHLRMCTDLLFSLALQPPEYTLPNTRYSTPNVHVRSKLTHNTQETTKN